MTEVTRLKRIEDAARTFLACHDAFMMKQERATAYAMKDAADSLRAALAAPLPEPIKFCDVCSHAMYLHEPDGSCGCGMRCRQP